MLVARVAGSQSRRALESRTSTPSRLSAVTETVQQEEEQLAMQKRSVSQAAAQDGGEDGEIAAKENQSQELEQKLDAKSFVKEPAETVAAEKIVKEIVKVRWAEDVEAMFAKAMASAPPWQRVDPDGMEYDRFSKRRSRERLAEEACNAATWRARLGSRSKSHPRCSSVSSFFCTRLGQALGARYSPFDCVFGTWSLCLCRSGGVTLVGVRGFDG
ncbi:unnamed protein product [Prorocentrum cordatum]|uniref:Uncharacterized protein n=1 Tax=Prorocentrum cordatum TaxID=2364126 RepID=A0ABN9SVK7_9DINO|nr:unnamed protein product [Polarella glacialis]